MSEDGSTGTPASSASDQSADAAKSSDGGKKPGDSRGSAEDPYGAERRQFEEAYRRGILRTDGPMAFLRDAKIQKQHIGNIYNIYDGGWRAVRSGSVRTDYLVWIRDRYVAVADYERMFGTLKSRNLLVLNGRPGTGRLTTALRLLDELAHGNVSRFDEGQDIEKLTAEDFASGRGYVLELTGADGAVLTETKLDKLRDVVSTQSYCVVIVETDAGTNGIGGYAVEYGPPDRDQLLQRHLTREVREDDDAGVEDLLVQLADTAELRAALGPKPRPIETAEMARLLAEFGRGHLTLEQVQTQAAQLVQRQVVEWFADLAAARSDKSMNEALRLAAFRIALAVFNNSPYHIVANAGVNLAARFQDAVSGTAKKEPSLFADDQNRRLPISRAELVNGRMSFGRFSLAVDLAKYADDRFPVVLLSYVWQQHHNLRAAMVSWLQKQSKDPRPAIWVRAAQATGLFCSLDFHFTYTKMIASAAFATGKKSQQRRLFAAITLDQAARDERITDAIRERLTYWRRHGSEAQKWTAAAALGYDLGRRSIDSTLAELRVLGTPSEQQSALDESDHGDLVWISAYSLANLLAFGEVRPILRQLAVWTGSDRHSLRELAWCALLDLVDLYGSDLDLLQMSAGRVERPQLRTRTHWPLLLALQEEDRQLTAQIAELLRWGLRGRRGDFVAKYLFGPWIRAAEKDPACLSSLVCFIPNLVRDDGDTNRLGYLITRLRRDWCEPLDDRAAALLTAAIQKEAS